MAATSSSIRLLVDGSFLGLTVMSDPYGNRKLLGTPLDKSNLSCIDSTFLCGKCKPHLLVDHKGRMNNPITRFIVWRDFGLIQRLLKLLKGHCFDIDTAGCS